MSRIAIGGATGLIGGELARSLAADGHRVHRITRRAEVAGEDDLVWDPSTGRLDARALEGVDVVVNLVGEPFGARRWNADVKERIRVSRVGSTRLLADAIARASRPPKVFVSASAVGVYGDRGDAELTEQDPPGHDFLAEVCVAWEQAADPARDAGSRVVHPRTGVVIAREGPLIEKVERPFRMGVGGRVGSGRQYVPWISLVDHVRALRHLIDSELHGPVNLVAPRAMTNRELTRALGRALRRPAVLPIPVFALRVLYGEMGAVLATTSQRVVPQRLLESGFAFTHLDIASALEDALRDAGASGS